MGKKGSKQAKTKNKRPLWQRILKIFGFIVGGIVLLYGLYFLSWLPEYGEVWEMEREPMASKALLGMELKSSHERHRVPASRSIVGKDSSPSVNRYFYMPKGETQKSLLEKIKKEAEKGGWVVDERSMRFRDHFSAKKDTLLLSAGVHPDSEYSPVYVSIEGV